MYHGTGTLLTMDLTGILWVRTVMYMLITLKYLCILVIYKVGTAFSGYNNP